MVTALLNADKVQKRSIKWGIIEDHATFEEKSK